MAYVFTGADLEGRVKPFLEPRRDDDDDDDDEGEEGRSGDDEEWGSNAAGITWRALAIETVNYSGEAVAMVVAEDPYTAEDGAELVVVEYDTLAAVVDPEAALKPDSPKSTITCRATSRRTIRSRLATSRRRSRARTKWSRSSSTTSASAPRPWSPEASWRRFDQGTGVLTVHLSTQDPHGARDELAEILSDGAGEGEDHRARRRWRLRRQVGHLS